MLPFLCLCVYFCKQGCYEKKTSALILYPYAVISGVEQNMNMEDWSTVYYNVHSIKKIQAVKYLVIRKSWGVAYEYSQSYSWAK